MKKRVLCYVFLLFVFIFICCLNIFANDANTTVSGWSLTTPYHMGTKNCSYSYDNSSVKTAYEDYFTAAIGLWGNNINMTYTSNLESAVLVLMEYDLTDNEIMGTLNFLYETTTGHKVKCFIVIDPVMFNDPSITVEGKNILLAHEIGHVYGLDHAPSSSSIMYDGYSTTKNVTSQDIWGMKVVTHVHTHGPVVMGTTYDFIDASYHYVTCNSCKGKVKRVHAPNAYGVCACGYTGPFLYP